MVTEQECTKLTANLKDMLCSLCDTAHDRCAKLLTAKAKVGLACTCSFDISRNICSLFEKLTASY